MIGKRGSARRTAIDRWIISLHPMFSVITKRIQTVGETPIEIGPTFIDGHGLAKDRIRRGAVWPERSNNKGFHVDFGADGIIYKAWVAERHASLEVAGKATEATVERDLRGIFNLVGLRRGKLSASSHLPSVTGTVEKR